MSSTTETMNPEDNYIPSRSEADDERNEISSSDEDANGNSRRKKGRKRTNPEGEEDDGKKAERRAANRRSAFQSRQRRKILIEDLQRTVSALSKDNGDLRKTNDDLRVQLEGVVVENQQFRMQQQMSAQPAGMGLMGAPSLQSAQAQALLRGGGPSALSQLLAARGAAGPANPNQSGDPLLNARLALAAAQASGGKHNRSQDSVDGSQSSRENATSSPTGASPKQPQNGIQGILNAASVSNTQGCAGAPGLAGLQGLLQSNPGAARSAQLASLQGFLGATGGLPGLGGAGGPQLMGLLEQLRGGAHAGGLTDVQRARAQHSALGDNQNNVSDALRALLQKNK
jgi:hypothetical protein